MSPRIPIRLLATQSDERLATLVTEGHERAFEALVQRYRRPLLRYCRHLRLSDARAEDVLQQSFLRAWLALARGSEVRDLRPWLYRIVHNAAVNAMRGAAERPHGELTDALPARALAVGESELERRVAIRDALGEVAALPRMQQRAIFLTAVDGQSHDEVATVLGISEGALRGLLYRARTTLRSAAAALTPPPLLEWAVRSADTAGPTAERLAELSAAGGGAAGMAGLLLKGAVVAVTAGAVATGATVVNSHRHGDRPAAHGTSVAGLVAATGDRQSPVNGVALVSASQPRAGSGEHSGSRPHHGRGHGFDGSRGGTPAHREDRSSSGSDRQTGSRPDGGGGDGQTHQGAGSGQDLSEGKGTGSSVGAGSPDGRDGSGTSGGGDGASDSGHQQSNTDGGKQASVTSGATSDGKGGSTSGSGQDAAAVAPAASDASSGDQGPRDESGKRDG